MKNQKGFTLIELLVVISIVGLLSSVVLASLNSARQKARFAKKQAELAQLLSAVRTYYLDKDAMPVNANLSAGWCVPGINYSGTVCLQELIDSGYFSVLPISPDSSLYYYYYDYGTFGLVASRMVPEQYGPGSRGWHCSASAGGSVGSMYYCLEFDK